MTRGSLLVIPSLLGPARCPIMRRPRTCRACSLEVGADQSLYLDNDQHVLRFSDRVDGTGGGVGLPGRQSCRWPVSEQGLII